MRARNIKPGFFKNEELWDVEPLTRLLFIGLWCLADREGRLEDRPKRIKAEILPSDEHDTDAGLKSLHDCGLIQRYVVDGSSYIQVTNFVKHQKPHIKEAASIIPAPHGHTDSGVVPYYVTPEQNALIMARYDYKCCECGAESDLSIDHIVPRSKGGSNDNDNLQVLCRKCNSSKDNRTKSPGISRSSPEKVVPGPGKAIASPAESPFSESPFSDCLIADCRDSQDHHRPLLNDTEQDTLGKKHKDDLAAIEARARDIKMPPWGVADEQTAERLVADYTAAWLLEAMNRAASGQASCRSWRYIEGILKIWKKNGGPENDAKPFQHVGKRVEAQNYTQRQYPEIDLNSFAAKMMEKDGVAYAGKEKEGG